MATYLYANSNVTTTLAGNGGSITAAATSFSVASSTGFPAASSTTGQFVVQIDAEWILVTNVSGTTWTVTRGAGGSTAATHTDGALIQVVESAESAGNAVQLSPSAAQSGSVNVTGSGTFAGSVVTKTKAGVPTDSDVTNPADGMIVLDTTDNVNFVRSGGVWIPSAGTTRSAVPNDHGFVAWSFDPIIATSSTAIAKGSLSLIKVFVAAAATVGIVSYVVGVAGATLTSGQNLVGLYNAAGTLLGASADQSGVWTAVGAYATALTVQSGQSLAVSAQTSVYVAFLGNGTTMPTLARGANSVIATVGQSSGSQYRFGTYGSSLTALPATITPSTIAASITSYFVALS